jgi:hypothetical protein
MHSIKALQVLLLTILFCIVASSCENRSTRAVKVEIERTDEGFQLRRGGEPYFIKGARTIGTQYMDKVASIGGNSVRIGSGGDIQAKLDTAHTYGLSVLFGLPMASERNGFDYSDDQAVKEQYKNVKTYIEKYKDHPALLMWAIGNELDYVPDNPDYNQALWKAVNDIAIMIHALDPYHPAITVIGTGRKYKMEHIKEKLPDIDALGINSYGDIYEIPDWVKEYELEKPYLITEWGPTGHWQVPQNKWGLPVEETTTEKAVVYHERHEKVIAGDPFCLGGYSFLWTGGRQERTHTWYNMFFDHGEETEAVDVMQYVWTGSWPDNRAPKIDSVILAGQNKMHDIVLNPGNRYSAKVIATDPEEQTLTCEWEIYPENTEFGYAGHGEKRPESMNELIENRDQPEIRFNSPEKHGDYRLFVYIRDRENNIAMANIPFHVR